MARKGRERIATRRLALYASVAGLLGVMAGIGGFALFYAEVPSYFGSDPETCANCHVMNGHYDAWLAGAHAHVATCNDCHLPHDNIAHKYLVKAEDGLLHGVKFTTGNYPQNIVIRDKNLAIANAACLYCHTDLTDQMMSVMGADAESDSCVRCHEGVGHG